MRNKTLKQLMEAKGPENQINIDGLEPVKQDTSKEFQEMVDEIIEYVRINLTGNKNLN